MNYQRQSVPFNTTANQRYNQAIYNPQSQSSSQTNQPSRLTSNIEALTKYENDILQICNQQINIENAQERQPLENQCAVGRFDEYDLKFRAKLIAGYLSFEYLSLMRQQAPQSTILQAVISRQTHAYKVIDVMDPNMFSSPNVFTGKIIQLYYHYKSQLSNHKISGGSKQPGHVQDQEAFQFIDTGIPIHRSLEKFLYAMRKLVKINGLSVDKQNVPLFLSDQAQPSGMIVPWQYRQHSFFNSPYYQQHSNALNIQFEYIRNFQQEQEYLSTVVDFEIDPFCEEGPTIKCSRGEQSVIANIEAMSELMNFEADIDRLDAEMTEINYPEPPMAMTNIEQGRSPTTYQDNRPSSLQDIFERPQSGNRLRVQPPRVQEETTQVPQETQISSMSQVNMETGPNQS